SRPRLAALSESLVRPVITWTRSPFLIFIFAMSHHLRCQRDDLHEALVTQLAAHGAEDAGAARLAVGLEDDRCVLVEADVGAVDATDFLGRADDDRLDDVALLDVATGDGVLDGRHDGVADAGVTATGATENTDAENLLGTRVVGDLQSRLLLNHSFSYRLTGSLPARRAGRPSLAERNMDLARYRPWSEIRPEASPSTGAGHQKSPLPDSGTGMVNAERSPLGARSPTRRDLVVPDPVAKHDARHPGVRARSSGNRSRRRVPLVPVTPSGRAPPCGLALPCGGGSA